MADGIGGGPPYATASLIFELADKPSYKAFILGKLAIYGIDLRVPLATWLDAVYAIVMSEMDADRLDKMHASVTIASARARPDRESWGLTPDQVALSSKMTKQQPPQAVPGGHVRRGGFGPASK